MVIGSTNKLGLTEILGALAVVLSLVFVGVQIRENNRATKSAMASASVDSLSAWYVEIANNEQSSALMVHYLSDPNSLSVEKRFQATMNLHGLLLIFQNAFYLANEGTLEQSILYSMTETVLGIKEQPGFHLYWKQRKSIFTGGFQDYINTLVASDRSASEGLFISTDSDSPSNKTTNSPAEQTGKH
jgi:hypothetical protein